jgi:hypothetical protein
VTQPIDFTGARERLNYRNQVRERRAFGNEIKAETMTRVTGIVTAYLGGAANPSAVIAVMRNLAEKMCADSHLAEELAELQMLPVADESSRQRLAVLKEGARRHLPEAVREVLPDHPKLDSVAERVATGINKQS